MLVVALLVADGITAIVELESATAVQNFSVCAAPWQHRVIGVRSVHINAIASRGR